MCKLRSWTPRHGRSETSAGQNRWNARHKKANVSKRFRLQLKTTAIKKIIPCRFLKNRRPPGCCFFCKILLLRSPRALPARDRTMIFHAIRTSWLVSGDSMKLTVVSHCVRPWRVVTLGFLNPSTLPYLSISSHIRTLQTLHHSPIDKVADATFSQSLTNQYMPMQMPSVPLSVEDNRQYKLIGANEWLRRSFKLGR